MNEYLIIEVLESGNIYFTYGDEGYFVYYRINNGLWTLFQNTKGVPIESGQIIECKCLYENINDFGIGHFNITSKCKLRGNCLSLIFGDNAAGKTDISNYPCAFQTLFMNCNVAEVDKYFLPATTLADHCYSSMFYGCSSLVNAPELPATTLAESCYKNMFFGCANLNYIKMLATDISAPYCLSYWVSGVSSTGTFVKHPDMTSLPTGVNGIPEGWTVVKDGEESGGLINFTIDETSYQAEEGMTWEEWVNSSYNTYGFEILFDGTINIGMYFIGTEEDYVSSSDIILEDYQYLLVA